MRGSLEVVDLDGHEIRQARRAFKVPGGRRGRRPTRRPVSPLAGSKQRD
jgi:hypothetical protein